MKRPTGRRGAAPPRPTRPPPDPRPRPPIVAIGASAGGLEAFEQFFRNQAPDVGVAFVLVPHLAPGHASLLTEILQRTTTMPVVEATDQMPVVANRVHVIPPNRDLTVFDGVLQLRVPDLPHGQRLPIDTFFRSLAQEQGEAAIAVVLSGTGSDGTLGLRAVLGAGGVSLVQEPAGARYDGMPTSAIQNGLATYVLPVEEMPARIGECLKTAPGRPGDAELPATAGALRRVLQQLRAETGHDFSLYKKSTVHRRVLRRMGVVGVETVDAYGQLLRERPAEVQLLFKELLINVTSFFRDPAAFEALRLEVLPLVLADRPPERPIRVWVAGCSTGEEAYSIAIVLREHLDAAGLEPRIQIYATDIDEDAITSARAGLYPPNIAADVTPERLTRFFSKEDGGYRVRRVIRDMIVFAVQDLAKDPPFTKLDLLSCRNVLIYFEPALQDRLLPSFHYALAPGGGLFLAPSESIGNHVDLFSALDRRSKFFRRKPLASSGQSFPSTFARTADLSTTRPAESPAAPGRVDLADLTRRALLKSFAPPSVVTDTKGEILYVHGDVSPYLRPPPGQASLNAVAMAREGLQHELRAALQAASTRGRAVLRRAVAVREGDGLRHVDLAVRPLSAQVEGVRRQLIVSFTDAAPPPERGRKKPAPRAASARKLEELEETLVYTRETLQATIEEQQASNEELQSANEELQSANEELQSTNEELETSKEELQSLNEEMVTVNAELQAKIDELAGTQNDLKNLLDSTNIGTIFLDERLAIRRFSREATALFRLMPSDVGRSLGDIKANFAEEGVVADARAVLDSLVPRERSVQVGNRRYLVRLLVYRTIENVIAGVVMTFTDVTDLGAAGAAGRVPPGRRGTS